MNPLYVEKQKITSIVFFQESLDNITLFSIITIMSFFLLAPVAILMEGVKFTPAYLQSAVSILLVKVARIAVIIGTFKKYNCV